MKLTTALRSAIAQELLGAIAAGTTSPSPVIEVYNGSMVPSFGEPIIDTLLGTLTLTAGAGTVTNGALTFDVIAEDSSADASGDATWCRALDRDGVEAVYFSISDNAGTGDIKFNTTSIVSGAPIAITSLTVTVGGE